VAAVLISLFGWILALRGLVLMAAPQLYEHAATSMDAIPLVRLIFGVLVAIGFYLTTHERGPTIRNIGAHFEGPLSASDAVKPGGMAHDNVTYGRQVLP
jgi:uncharacterized protein YjeT (DUF2065 family)